MLTTTTKKVVCVRWMIRRDMPEVLNIENQCFDFPWSDVDFARYLRQHNCIGMVAEFNERVVGFMIYGLYKTYLHVVNFAVVHDCRRSSVGKQMAAHLIAKLSNQLRNRIRLEVWENNLAAQLFFRAQGFRAVAVLHDFYDDKAQDAYQMEYHYRGPEDTTYTTVNRISCPAR